jgi:hypothetical protein
VAAIQKKVVKKSKRNTISRLFHAKDDKDTIANWKQDLNRILHIFNVRSVGSVLHLLTVPFQMELSINTNMLVAGIHRNALAGQEAADSRHQPVSTMFSTHQ